MRHNYPDNHPKQKGCVNWWEAEINTSCNKKAAKREAREFIRAAFMDVLEASLW